MTQTRKSAKSSSRKGARREMLLLLGIGVPVVIVFLIAFFATQQTPATEATPPTETGLLVRDDSPVLGPADAPVTLVEFLDPECEGCRAAYPIVKDLLATYGDQVRLVVRYVPRHNNSKLAAIATEAAGVQGKYWEMQELLFQNQLEWGEQTTSQREVFLRYAESLNLDMQQFVRDLENPEFAAKVDRDAQDSMALGVQGTPTFYVNGQLVEPLSVETLERMIQEGLP